MSFRACLKIPRGTAAMGLGRGEGGEVGASPQFSNAASAIFGLGDTRAFGNLRCLFAAKVLWQQWLIVTVFIWAGMSPSTARAHGELELRIAELTRQIDAATNNPAVLYLERGELHREHKDWPAAKSDYDRAAQIGCDPVALDLCRAKMSDDSGNLDEALALFDKVLARSPDNGEALIGRARIHVKLKQRPKAISEFQRGLELLAEPQPAHFLELARILVAEGQETIALKTLDQGIRKFGSVEELQSYALDIELGAGNVDGALIRLDAIVDRAPRKETWLARRGEILLAAGKLADARNSLKASLIAIDRLPKRLQQGPAMQQLQSRIKDALAKIDRQTLPKPSADSGNRTNP